jgi:chromate transporter
MTPETQYAPETQSPPGPVSFAAATRVWLSIALLSFGGPAGQIALMHRTLVDERKWISERRFLHALNFCMLLPGPEAQRLATYFGWLMHWIAGGLIAGGLFILPGAVAIMALSLVYATYGATPIAGGAFFGLKAAVLALVFAALWLAPAEMLDGLGMAETTPGPLIMVLQFVGFMAAFRHAGALPPLFAGALGGLLAAYVTFAPCFPSIFAGAPFVERLRENRALTAALAAVSAAVIGVIANLALWFATHFLFRDHARATMPGVAIDVPILESLDLRALLIAGLAGAAMRFGLGPPATLFLCVGAGLASRLL